MTSSPDFILGEDRVQGIQRVLGIYGEITANKKLYNEKVAQKLKTHILALNNDPFFSQNVQHIWSGITDKHRDSLTSFMK
jgi:predicted metal-dependent RNase